MQRVFHPSEPPRFGLPLLELWGQNRVLIEHHDGIAHYGTDHIRIKVKYGSLDIEGQELKLRKICPLQLVITGKIASIAINREDAP